MRIRKSILEEPDDLDGMSLYGLMKLWAEERLPFGRFLMIYESVIMPFIAFVEIVTVEGGKAYKFQTEVGEHIATHKFIMLPSREYSVQFFVEGDADSGEERAALQAERWKQVGYIERRFPEELRLHLRTHFQNKSSKKGPGRPQKLTEEEIIEAAGEVGQFIIEYDYDPDDALEWVANKYDVDEKTLKKYFTKRPEIDPLPTEES